MATNTYVALQTTTVTGSSAASVTFSPISQNYTDLEIVVAGLSSANTSYKVQFNSDTGVNTNYSVTYMYGDGTTAPSGRDPNINGITGMARTGTSQGNGVIKIMNYSNSTTYKTVLGRGNLSTQLTIAAVGYWRSTAPITSITLTPESGNISIGTTFTIYGIAAEGTAIAPKAIGGAIYSDSLYYYHVFGSTGVFTPSASLTADVLVVAGGGGGGGEKGQSQACSGGGGGAGGLLGFTTQSLSATGYTVTVAAGGAGGGGGSNKGTNGGDSQFGALTLVKGGGGGGTNYDGSSASLMTPLSGGSGGGAGGTYTGATGNTAGAAVSVSGQGNAGGANGVTRCGGGGGGSGVAGGAALDNNIAGAGGNGLSTYSSWGLATGVGQNVSGTYYIAGGGGGGMWDTTNTTLGAGGYGGGAAGNAYGVAGSNATPNTGGGGSGASASTSVNLGGGNGGSGVVIVRYLKA